MAYLSTDNVPFLISIDPGKNTGLAEWDKQCNIMNVATVNQNELDNFLDNLQDKIHIKDMKPEVIVIEEYIGRPGSYHSGSKIETVRVLGQIRDFGRRNKIKVVKQMAGILPIASAWARMPLPKGHLPDWKSAYLHGYYYLQKNDYIRPRVLDELEES